jgi:hypothetical protein
VNGGALTVIMAANTEIVAVTAAADMEIVDSAKSSDITSVLIRV